MGITLTGKRVQNTYDSLLKLSSNDNLTSTPQLVGDGLGNDSPIYLSETKVGIGVSPSFQFQTSDAAKIGGNLTVGGNLIVEGSVTQVDSTIVEIGDNMIELAKDNIANIKDIGWYGTIVESGTKYVGTYYDASSGITAPTFYIGLGTTEPSSTASWTVKGKLVIGDLSANGGDFTDTVYIDDHLEIENSDGYGYIELGGSSGGYIDLKGPFSNDFDLRIFTGGVNSQINAIAGSLDITANSGIDLQYQGSNKLTVISTGIDITGNLFVSGGFKDSDEELGTSGQVLSSTGTGTDWIDNEADSAKALEIDVKNVHGGTLAKGTVVHAEPTGTLSGNVIEVVAADANVAANMPAIGVLNEDLNDDEEGKAVMFGTVQGIDTLSFSVGDELYVSTTAGAFTNTKPTATTEQVQKIAVVVKSHASNGLIKVFGAGRSNDVPNLIERSVAFDGGNLSFGDDDKIIFGDNQDFNIQSNGVNTFLSNLNNNLVIQNSADDKDIIFRSDNGDGTSVSNYLVIDGSTGGVNLYHYGTKKFETTSYGALISGQLISEHTSADIPLGATTANLYIKDDRAIAADVGGSIVFSGKYSGSTYLSGGPYIKGYKLNANSGDYSFGLKFGIRKNGAGVSGPVLTLDPDSNATFTGDIFGNLIELEGVGFKGGEGDVLDDSDFNESGVGNTFRWVHKDSSTSGSTWQKVADVTLDLFLPNGCSMDVKVILPNDENGNSASQETLFYSVSFRGADSDTVLYGDAIVYGPDAGKLRVYRSANRTYELQARTEDNDRSIIVEYTITSKYNAKVILTESITAGTTSGGTAYTATQNNNNKTKFAGELDFLGVTIGDDLRVNGILYLGAGADTTYGGYLTNKGAANEGISMKVRDDDGFDIYQVWGNAGEASLSFEAIDEAVKLYYAGSEKLKTTSSGVTVTGQLIASTLLINGTANREFYIDTTNPDHLKKNQNLVLSADPDNSHTNTVIEFHIDGSEKASLNSTGNFSANGRGTFNELELTSGADHLTITETGGDWTINNAQQNNGITIYDGTGGVDINYNGSSYFEVDASGVHTSANIDFYVDTNLLYVDAVNNLIGISKTPSTYKLDVNGKIASDDYIIAGLGNGGVALTHNDGGGNANVTFNHVSETPEQNGNSFRIRANTDSSSGAIMRFEIAEGVTSGVAVTTTEVFRLEPQNATFTGDITVNGGDITLGGTGRIQGIDTVSAGTDAVNKNYVDNAVSGFIDGSGTTNRVALWTDSDTLGSSNIVQDGTNVAIGITSADYRLDVGGAIGLSGRLHIDTVGDEYKIGADDYTSDQTSGVMIRPADNANPTDGDSLFIVRSGGGSPRFFVEHSGTTGTTNTTFTVGAGSTRGNGNVVLSATGDSYISGGGLSVGTTDATGNFLSYISASRQLTHNGNGGDLSIISDNNSTPVMYIKGTGTADLVNVFDNTTEVFTIEDGGNATFAADVTIDGDLYIPDSSKVHIGSNLDLQLYHDGANSYIETSTSSAGDLYIKAQGSGHDLYLQAVDDIFIRPQGGENGIAILGNAGINLYYNNSTRMQITNDGAIVRGDATNKGILQFSNSVSTYYIRGGANWGYLSYHTGGYHRWFGSDDAEDMRLDSTGLGIGITPTNRLHVYHPTTNVVAKFESGDTAAYIELHDDSSGTYGCLLGHQAGVNKLFNVSDANVTKHFEIVSASAGAGVKGADFYTDGVYGVQIHGDGNSSEGGHLTLKKASSYTYQWVLDNYQDKLRIVRQDDDGNNGVVYAEFASDGDLQIARYIEHDGDTNSYLGWSGGDDFRIVTGGRELVRLDEGTNPDIAKFMTDEFRMYSNGDFHADGDIIAYSTTASSDKRLKKNIKPIDNALNIVDKLQGVHFNWKKDDKKSIGYIAQDVEKVLPEMVKEQEHFNEGTYKTVNYAAMVSIMGEAIKELSAKVEALENKKCNCNCK